MNVHVTISLDQDVLKGFDAWWKKEEFPSRSEAIAYLMKSANKDVRKEEATSDQDY